jgi:8-amino-7-oxononanoate synthase
LNPPPPANEPCATLDDVPPAGATLDEIAHAKLAALERRSLRRHLVTTDRCGGAGARIGDEQLISFSCNDYLGLSHHPAVIAASIDATRRYGVGAGAARLVTGNHPAYSELERKLAAFKGTQDAVVFGSGYLTNIGVIPAVVGKADLILLDELSHSCLLAGAKLSGSRVLEHRHNDVEHAAALLEQHRPQHRHCLLVTDGVFSMDGDLAPLPQLAALAARHDAWLLSDDAHGLGVLGGGRGSSFAFGEAVGVPLQMGTLSKAAGSYGGYVCASRAVAELIRNRAASFVYSTGLPPGAVAAASAALDIIAADPTLAARPLARAALFTAALGIAPAQSPIVSVVFGAAQRALDASARLRANGYLVTAIRPPTVPAGTSRLRFAFSAEHSVEQVAALADAVRPLLTDS